MITPEQEQVLRRAAKERGLDPDEVVRRANKESTDENARGASSDLPKLFQYHLPFIRVRELRKIWLGLEERVEDDDMLCGEFAVKHGGGMTIGTGPDGAGQ